MSKYAYLLKKPFSEFTDKEWKLFEKYLNTREMQEDLLEIKKKTKEEK